MKNKINVIVGILFLVGFILLFQKLSSSQENVRILISQVDSLEADLIEAKEKISELEEANSEQEATNSELEEKLSDVQHFDDSGAIGQGFTETWTNYTGQVLETKIDGKFEGWEGETIFKMMNGTIWQQTSYSYKYHYAYMPSVIIYKKRGTYYMKVEDVDDEIQVRQIK